MCVAIGAAALALVLESIKKFEIFSTQKDNSKASTW